MFRALAVLLGLAPFAIAETVLRVLDSGPSRSPHESRVTFREDRPLFVRSEDGTRYEVAAARRLCFEAESFPVVKPPGESRAFCLGGSTVQGHPFSVPTSFTTWLEIGLNSADPTRSWDVVNCGGVSYASYRLRPILEEVLNYDPDLIILYIGDNEFLEDRSYPKARTTASIARALGRIAERSRLVSALRDAWTGRAAAMRERTDPRPILPTEVDALLDYRGGLEHYHRDDAWHAAVLADYEDNLRAMVAKCQDAGVRVVLVAPVCNLETPPFKAEHRPGLSSQDRRQFDAHWDSARSLYGHNLPRAAQFLKLAAAIDPEHAGLQYALGLALQELGRLDEARAALSRARDVDVCPLRVTSEMGAIVARVARESGVPFLDAFRLFAERSPGGIPGDKWLVDHVHPSIPGYQLLARALLDLLAREGTVALRPGWEATYQHRAEEHLASLNDFYYMKAEQRLQNLEAWARGRASRLRSAGSIGEEFARHLSNARSSAATP